jgi:hypothetical protein
VSIALDLLLCIQMQKKEKKTGLTFDSGQMWSKALFPKLVWKCISGKVYVELIVEILLRSEGGEIKSGHIHKPGGQDS